MSEFKPCPMGCVGEVIGGEHEGACVYCKVCHLRAVSPRAWNTRSDPRYEELLKLAEGMAAATSDLHHIGVCRARDALCAFLQHQKDTEHG